MRATLSIMFKVQSWSFRVLCRCFLTRYRTVKPHIRLAAGFLYVLDHAAHCTNTDSHSPLIKRQNLEGEWIFLCGEINFVEDSQLNLFNYNSGKHVIICSVLETYETVGSGIEERATLSQYVPFFSPFCRSIYFCGVSQVPLCLSGKQKAANALQNPYTWTRLGLYTVESVGQLFMR